MEAKSKERADQLVVRQGIAPTREKAKAMIMAGQVFVGEIRVEKAGQLLDTTCTLRYKGALIPYVSRGGLKLGKALESFDISLTDKTVLDIGASTGGFTDCALQKGAAKVYAVDVGYGQLDWRLRQDERVIVKEKTNARYLSPEELGSQVDFVTIDVSFISLDKMLPNLAPLLKEKGQGIALIKPQFEAGRDKVGKKGVVRDPLIHEEVIDKIINSLPGFGLTYYNLTFSPIKGPEGNIEYLLWFGLGEGSQENSINQEAPSAKDIVEAAFNNLNSAEKGGKNNT